MKVSYRDERRRIVECVREDSIMMRVPKIHLTSLTAQQQAQVLSICSIDGTFVVDIIGSSAKDGSERQVSPTRTVYLYSGGAEAPSLLSISGSVPTVSPKAGYDAHAGGPLWLNRDI